MHLRKRMRQGISTVLIAAMGLSNVMSAAAAPVSSGASTEAATVSNDNYRATVHLSGDILGGLSVSKHSDTSAQWNTMDAELVPGMTMLLDSNNAAKKGNVIAKGTMTTGDGSIGASGIVLDGDLSGVKSYFMFNDEILCLGNGLSGTGEDSVITVVDNVPITNNTIAQIPNPNNGYRNIKSAIETANAKQSWASVVDNPTKGKHGRDWIVATDLKDNNLQWQYLFGKTISNSNVYYRFSKNGTESAQLYETWVQSSDYSYTLKAGGSFADGKGIKGSTNAPKNNTILVNNKEIQAAEAVGQATVAVNKWTDGSYELDGSVAKLSLNQPMSLVLKKDENTGTTEIRVGKLSSDTSSEIEFAVELEANMVTETSGTGALKSYAADDKKVTIKLDPSKMTEPVALTVSYKTAEVVTADKITLVRNEEKQVELPEGFSADDVTWVTRFVKKDGSYIKNVGSSKKKQELKDGETDSNRVSGETSAEHLLAVEKLANGNAKITAKEKGNLVLVARNSAGKEARFEIEILYFDPIELPEATPEDYSKIRQAWKEYIVGVDLQNEASGADIIASVDKKAQEAWDTYDYKGQDVCPTVPWSSDLGVKGNADRPYEDDAVEFRPTFQKVLAMATAYATEGSCYYQNADMLADIIHILDYLCTVCYTPKSQTDNWWTWEIGIPKDLIPILILIYEELNEEQIETYTEALYFFQPDPYHEGSIGTGSTHAQGYRVAGAANLVDCATTAIGIGALREDNEMINIAVEATSTTFVIRSIEDSTKLADDGFTSGFYADGSYLDHSRVPYLGSYGLEFMNGALKIPSWIGGTAWKYPAEVQQNLEYYIVNGFGSSMYRGLMLDSLKGRSVSRPAGSNRDAGRTAMSIILKMVDNLSDSAKEQVYSMLKEWMQYDPEFIDSLTGVTDLSAKKKAREILEDSSIEANVEPLHKSFPLMDRAVHRTDDYLFSLAMYSERIQNTEIMNHENRMGWHQGNGMTYIYDADQTQYTENFWNTVNPLRLAGTTVASVDIGTGTPDGSGFIQGGDFCSYESWVGGTSIGNYGISGMSFSGAIANKAKAADEVRYAPNLKGKKSWFMFENEIVALGAGITNRGMDAPVETTIENRKLEDDNAFTVNGKETDLEVKEAKLTELVDGTADVSGTEFNGVEWAHLEGNGDSEGTGYYFPEDGAQIQARRARTTGNWSDIGTSEGESTQDYLEMWVDHGKNPTNGTYSYVLLPETSADDTEEYANAPKVTVLANTEKVQAVYQQELGITGINFWEDEETTIAGVTCSGQASVMLQESEDGRLKVALSDPTMKNTESIKLTIDRPVADVTDCDDKVEYDLNEDGSVTLIFKMSGSNGYSLNAELQLEASIYPSAVTLRKGEEQAFEVRTFGEEAGNVTWSVSTAETRMVSGTTIDENGVLTVAENETDGALAVTAKLESGAELHAYVSLGKDAAIDIPSDLPEEMQALKEIIDAALGESDDLIGYDLEAVKRAVKAVQEADSEKLAEYLSEEVLELAEAYVLTWNENDMEIGEYVETVGSAEELEPAIGTGMALSIYPSTFAASPSNAVLVITGTVEDEEEATPSNATPSNATASNATKLNGKEIVEGTLSSYVLELFREYEDDEDGRRKLPMKGLIELSVSLPEQLDADKPVIAVIVDKSGKQHPVQAEVEDGTLTILITRMGTLKVANLVEEENGDEGEDAIYEVYFEDEFVGGTVTADPTSGTKGTKITLTVKADKGYKLDYLMVNGKVVTVRGNKYTFELEEDTEVKAVFKKRANVSVKEDDEDEDDDDSYSSTSGGSGSGGGVVYSSKDGNSWQYINGQWFAYDANGNARTGWYLESLDGYWYYLKPNGVMATGWEYINGKWYYFNPVTIGVTGWTGSYKTWDYVAQPNPGMPQGAMYSNQMTPDGYLVDDQGAWIQ